MTIDPGVRALLLSIMRQFPDVAVRMKARAREHRSVAFSTTAMMEAFAGATQQALRRGDEAQVRAHLRFLADWLGRADAVQHEYIDVYYVEGLLFGLPRAQQRSLWAAMPPPLRALHTRMWGSFEAFQARR